MKLSTIGLGFAAAALALSIGACRPGKTDKGDDPGQTTTTSATVKGAAIKGSCNLRTTASSCSQENDKSDELGLAKGLCDAIKGSWAEHTACPEDHLIAKCEAKDGHLTYYYSDSPLPHDADSVKESCNMPGDKVTIVPQAAPAKDTVAAKKPAAPAAKKK